MTMTELDRSAKLEHGTSGWRRACALAAGAILLSASIVALGMMRMEEPSQVIRSQRFELVDKDGAVVGILGTDQGHYPYCELNCAGTGGEGGRVRIEVPWGGGPGCVLTDNAGRKRAQLHLGPKVVQLQGEKPIRTVGGQVPGLCFLDEQARLRLSLGSVFDESVRIEFRDAEGKVLVRIPE